MRLEKGAVLRVGPVLWDTDGGVFVCAVEVERRVWKGGWVEVEWETVVECSNRSAHAAIELAEKNKDNLEVHLLAIPDDE